MERRAWLDSEDGCRTERGASAKADGHLTLPLDGLHARDVQGVHDGSSRASVVERHCEVLAVRDLELETQHLVHRVAHDAPRHDDRGRERDGCGREGEAPGAPQEVAHDHPRDGGEERVERIEARRVVVRRRLGPHRLGRRDRHGLPHGGYGAENARGHGDERGDDHGARVEAKQVRRKPEVLRVDPEEALGGERAEDPAEQRAREADRERQLQVVDDELARPVAERLERGDLLALRADDARQEHVKEERRDAEEDDREGGRQLAKLRDLLVDQLARRLVPPPDRAEPAVRLEDGVDAVDRLAFVGADGELDRRVVEGAHEPGGLRQRLAVHPGDAEVPRVGEARSRGGGPDELGRHRGPDDLELREPPVDDRLHHRPRPELPRLREHRAEHDLVRAPWLHLPP